MDRTEKIEDVELKRATSCGSRVREEIGNYRVEEHSRELFGERRFAVWRVGKKHRDGSTKLHRVGWYRTYRGAIEALSLDRQKREGDCPWPGITQESELLRNRSIDGMAKNSDCSSCRFWLKLDCLADEPSRSWGMCRRNPPSYNFQDDENDMEMGDWPSTWSDQWCGEWQRRGFVTEFPERE